MPVLRKRLLASVGCLQGGPVSGSSKNFVLAEVLKVPDYTYLDLLDLNSPDITFWTRLSTFPKFVDTSTAEPITLILTLLVQSLGRHNLVFIRNFFGSARPIYPDLVLKMIKRKQFYFLSLSKPF